jgi:hypothetical protein
MEKHPFAFLLLSIIAIRARRIPNQIDGLEVGEAKIGDWKSLGGTYSQYRTALEILEKYGFIKVIFTNKKKGILEKCKNLATRIATLRAIKGTVVKLLNSDIWDINFEGYGHQDRDMDNDLIATWSRLDRDEEEGRKNDKKEERKDINPPLQTSPPTPHGGGGDSCESKKEDEVPKVYACLVELAMEYFMKQRITRECPDEVRLCRAVLRATAPGFVAKDLAAVILTNYAKNLPVKEKPVNTKEAMIENNRDFANRQLPHDIESSDGSSSIRKKDVGVEVKIHKLFRIIGFLQPEDEFREALQGAINKFDLEAI